MRPGLKVLYTTGYTRHPAVQGGGVESGTAVLQKPFTVDQLALKVRAALDT
jgi:hypothetical protein